MCRSAAETSSGGRVTARVYNWIVVRRPIQLAVVLLAILSVATAANDLAARTFELSDFLVNHLKVTDVGAKYSGKVAYHYACHLR